MPKSQVKCNIFVANNGEWTYQIIHGSRIILGPEETYKTRGNCRRAVRALAKICTYESLTSYVSPMQAACLHGLDVEQAAWDYQHGRN